MPVPLTDIAVAFLTGGVPTLLWLWFWLSEDRRHPEPKLMLLFSFILGALAVAVVQPIQAGLADLLGPGYTFPYFLGMAGIEEIVKFGLILLFISLTPFVDEPLDYAVYLITGALGFAAIENTLYLIDPIRAVFSEASIALASMRFLGSTLVHAVMAGILGLSLGVTYRKPITIRLGSFALGLILVTILHASFNFLIITGTNSGIIATLIGLWAISIVIMYKLEQLKRIS